MRVIITNQDPLDTPLPPELESYPDFQFGEEVNISVATYNAIFNLTFTNEVGMQQNRFKIVVISMDEAPEEIQQKKEVAALSAAQEADFQRLTETLDLYEAFVSGTLNIHQKFGISKDRTPEVAIELFKHFSSYSDPFSVPPEPEE